jgi:hypothetical protein
MIVVRLQLPIPALFVGWGGEHGRDEIGNVMPKASTTGGVRGLASHPSVCALTRDPTQRRVAGSHVLVCLGRAGRMETVVKPTSGVTDVADARDRWMDD